MHNIVFNYLYIPMNPLEICGHIFFSGGDNMCIIDLNQFLYYPIVS